MRTMTGTTAVPFSTLIADTIHAFGVVWAWNYYGRKHGMSRWEFRLWAKAALRARGEA